MKRDNFEKFITLLHENGIEKLYHITHRQNWDSIRTKGIYSSANLRRNNIQAQSSVDDVNQYVDIDSRLDDYVHLSFSPYPVFLEAAIKADMLDKDYLIIEISLDILNNDETIFCNMDSHYKDVSKGTNYCSLCNIDLNIASASQRKGIAAKHRRFCSAEILVPGFISSSLILNKTELDNRINEIQKEEAFRRTALVIMVDQTTNMNNEIAINGQEYRTISKHIEEAINKLVTRIALSYHTGGKILNRYDVAIVGFGNTDEAIPLWNSEFSYGCGPFRSVHTLYDSYVKHFGESPKWVRSSSNCQNSNIRKSFEKVKELLQDWLDNNSIYANPPVVLLLTSVSSIYDDPAGYIKGCSELKKLQTFSGNVLLWQIEYSSINKESILCPALEKEGESLDPIGSFMIQHGSLIPNNYLDRLNNLRENVVESDRYSCLGVNVDINDIADLLLEDLP